MSTCTYNSVSNVTRLQILRGKIYVLLQHPPGRPCHVSQEVAGAHSWSGWGSEAQVSSGTRLPEPGRGSQLRRTNMVVWDSWTTDHCRTTLDPLAGECVFLRECNIRPLTHRASFVGAACPAENLLADRCGTGGWVVCVHSAYAKWTQTQPAPLYD